MFRTLLYAGSAIGLTLAAETALQAQDVEVQEAPTADAAVTAPAEEAEADIVVTGSRVPRADLDSPSPLTTLGPDRFQNSAETNVVRQLQRLPSFDPGRSPIGGQAVSFAGSYADLRGLDRKRTLVLVDGRRWINTISDGGVDLSTIPPELIGRVDVLTGGASATYGSDAIAGVVNFILRDDFDGIELNAQTGLTDRGEATNSRIAATGGADFADGRGSAYFHISYDKTNRISANGRSFVEPVVINSGGAFVPLDSDVISSGSALVDSSRAFFADGELFSGPGVINAVGPGDLFNIGRYARLQTPAQKITAAAGIRFAISDTLKVYSDAIYISDQVKIIQAESAIGLSGERISTSNPFLGPLTQDYLTSLDSDQDGFVAVPGLSRRFSEVGEQVRNNNRDSWRILAGITADLGGDWNWDTSVIFAQSKNLIRFSGFVNYARLSQALDVVDTPGGPACRDTSSNCVPLNIFGTDTISDAAADFIRSNSMLSAKNKDVVVQSVVTGKPFELPAGPVGVSLGVEYKKSTANELPDDALLRGESDLVFARMSGSLETIEGFAEAVVPLLAEQPFAHYLGVELGARYSEFKPGGDAWTYKLLAEWSPIKPIKFRGGLQAATRAPNVYELAAGDQGFFPIGILGDPCFTGAPLTGTLRSACIATGVPEAVADAGAVEPSGQLFQYTAFGNPNLTPEKAKTYTVGAVLTDILPRFSTTVDYYKIKISNTIGAFGPFNIYNQCYFNGSGGTSPLCAQIGRDPTTGVLTQFRDNFNNVGRLDVQGIDFGLNYRHPLSAADSLTVNVIATRLLEFRTTPFALESDSSFDCSGLYGAQCGQPRPEWKANTRLGWSNQRLNLALTWTWIGSSNDDATEFDEGEVPNLARTGIGAKHYLDLDATFDLSDQIELRGGIYNLLDAKPPIVGADRTGLGESSSFPGLYDNIGRRFYVGARVKL